MLISTHVCHPSLANDNLSGIAVATFLAPTLDAAAAAALLPLPVRARHDRRDHLAAREPGEHVAQVKHGLVLTCVGDAGAVTYKRSRRGDAEIDRAVAHVLAHSGDAVRAARLLARTATTSASTARPASTFPVGCLMRTPHGRFPEYHTSADDLDFVRPEASATRSPRCWRRSRCSNTTRRYVNLNPMCEPQLGRRGLCTARSAARKERKRRASWRCSGC